MISKLAHKSEVGATKLLGLEMGGDFAAPLGDKLFGAQKKLAPLCGEMRANFGHQKRIRPNVLTKHQCRPCGNPPNRILEPRDIGHDRWTLATLRFALGRASADRVATTTQIEKLRGVCPSRFVHARRPVQWPRQMGFSHIYIYIYRVVPYMIRVFLKD